MSIALLGKGANIGGRWHSPWSIITGLDPDKEAALVQGGGAISVGNADLGLMTAQQYAAVLALIAGGGGSGGGGTATLSSITSMTASNAQTDPDDVTLWVALPNIACDMVLIQNGSQFPIEYSRPGSQSTYGLTIPPGLTREVVVIANANELSIRRADYADIQVDSNATARNRGSVNLQCYSGARKFASAMVVRAQVVGQGVSYGAFNASTAGAATGQVLDLPNVLNQGLRYRINAGSILTLWPNEGILIPCTNATEVSVARWTNNNQGSFTTNVYAEMLTLAPGASFSSLTTLTQFQHARRLHLDAEVAMVGAMGQTSNYQRATLGQIIMGSVRNKHKKPGFRVLATADAAANLTVSGVSIADSAVGAMEEIFNGPNMVRTTSSATGGWWTQTALPGGSVDLTKGAIHVELGKAISSQSFTSIHIEVFSSGSPASPPANYHSGSAAGAATANICGAKLGSGRKAAITFPTSQLTAVGSGATLTAITWVRVVFTAAAGLMLGRVGYAPHIRKKAAVGFSFDDNISSVYNQVFTRFQKYGFPGILFPDSLNNLGDGSGIHTSEQLLAMQEAGWQIGTQTFNAEYSTDLMGRDLQRLSSRNFVGQRIYGYNGGEDFSYYSLSTQQNSMMGYGYQEQLRKMYRTSNLFQLNSQSNEALMYSETLPLADPMAITRYGWTSLAVLPNNHISAVTRAVTDKGFVLFGAHNEFNTAGSANHTNLDALLAFIDANRADVDVVTLEQLAQENATATALWELATI